MRRTEKVSEGEEKRERERYTEIPRESKKQRER